MSAIKVVINTHPSYLRALNILMESLDYRAHLADIVLVVADVPAPEADRVVAEYRAAFGADLAVLTDEANIAEYTSFLALGKALSASASASSAASASSGEQEYFLMIHDTCEVGRLFWWKLAKLYEMILTPQLVKDASIESCYHVSNDHKLQVCVPPAVYTIRQLCYIDNRLVCMCGRRDESLSFVGFLDSHGDITPDEEKALLFDFGGGSSGSSASSEEKDPSPSAEALMDHLRKQDVWFPLTENNFNIGIATREFLVDYAMPAFADLQKTTITKEEGINIELNPENPKNLRRLAGKRWRYLYKNVMHEPVPLFSIWRNDTDVYGNGSLRNVAYIHVLDLKKYTYLVGSKWSGDHVAAV
jgi:hypothetical protein